MQNPSVNMQTFRAHGKLMLTGEYLVLRGADSLSLPTVKGQTMKVSQKSGIPSLSWKTNVMGSYWFDARFSIPDFAIGNTNDFPTAQNLREILLAARELNPNFLNDEFLYDVRTDLDFDIHWGLGSSSSLLVNIASWAGVDPFRLHFKVSGGSGYDIAVSSSASPVIYRLKDGQPEFRKVSFDPVFKDKLYLVYLGKKRSSRQAIDKFNHVHHDFSSEINSVNEITHEMLRVNNLNDFIRLITRHERILSSVLDMPAPGSSRFFDFNGAVKSLGAWGGDFVLLASDYPLEYITSYLKRKDFNTWFQYSDLILQANTKQHA